MSARSPWRLFSNSVERCGLLSAALVQNVPFGRRCQLRLILFCVQWMLIPACLLAQDADTQRPLPLPTNDLPDFTQQLELLRKLQSVIRSREQQQSSQPASPRPESPSSKTHSLDSSPSKEDASQRSQLQNALKNLAGRLPPDFVPPSLDQIPKEDLRKAMENPAVRKTVQEMLRQFAKDGVIPPQTPSQQSDSAPTPLPPDENSSSKGPEPRAAAEPQERSASREPVAPRDHGNAAADSSSEAGQMPPGSDLPSTDSGSKVANGQTGTVPPSSLRSLEDLMNRLASEASSGDSNAAGGKAPDQSGENNRSSAGVDPRSSSATNRRNGPMRRRDPGANRGPQSQSTPPTNRRDVNQSRQNLSTNGANDQVNSPDNRQSSAETTSEQPTPDETGKTPGGESPPENRPQTQRRALEALQEIMEEMEQEEAESSAKSTVDREPHENAETRGELFESQSDSSGRRMDVKPADNNGTSSEESSVNGRKELQRDDLSSMAEMPSVQQFLKDEIERMRASSQDDESTQNPAERRSRNGRENRSAGSTDRPSIDPASEPIQSNDTNRSKSTNPSMLPDSDPTDGLPSQSRTRPIPSAEQQSRRDAEMSAGQSTVRPDISPAENQTASGQGPGSARSSAVPPINSRSAENIRRELEQRGVMETLKKTWEKSVQESRERRQQELQQNQTQPKASLSTEREQSSPVEDRISDLNRQLNEVAKSLGQNPNSEKAVADVVERIARDMSEQQRSQARRDDRTTASNSTMMERLNSEFPGKSMLRSIRDTVSDALTETVSPPAAAPRSSPPLGSDKLFGSAGNDTLDFAPILFLAGTLAIIAMLFYGLRAVRYRQSPEISLAGIVQNIRPSELSTRADIVRAFHEMAVRTARSAQLWWTHRKVQHVLKTVAPEKQEAVSTLVETYEQARYLPQDVELTADQIQSARSALEQLQT
ncbi:MAG: hypothetical protein ACK58L_22895 [Planctomycetota bacterium]